MRYRIAVLAISTLIGLLSSLLAHASDKTPLAYNTGLYREASINISDKALDSWAQAKRGTTISLPWFESTMLEIAVQDATYNGKHTTLTGSVNAEIAGGAVLVIGKNELVGAVTIDTENYRLWSKGDGVYSLIEVNSERLPEFPDTAKSIKHSDGETNIVCTDHNDDIFKTRQDGERLKLVKAELDKHYGITRTENGSRIDLLVAYSSDALNWAQRHNLNIELAIELMVGTTNLHFVTSGINTRLNLVGTTEVDHQVIDPKLQDDLDLLSTPFGTYYGVHALRDSLKADLVSFLVLNGEQGCQHEDGTICGIARLADRFMQPGDFSDSGSGFATLWENEFASNGFSVVSIYNGFHDHTFTHEIGHNLGAHHDKWAHYYNNDGPTADINARGWVMPNIRSRTVMSYNDMCKALGMYCNILPLFSNPLMTVGSTPQGDPVAGNLPAYMGPADNVSAINRMARSVSNYRQSF